MDGARLCVVDTALPLCCRKSTGAQKRKRLPKVPMQINCNTFTGFCASVGGGNCYWIVYCVPLPRYYRNAVWKTTEESRLPAPCFNHWAMLVVLHSDLALLSLEYSGIVDSGHYKVSEQRERFPLPWSWLSEKETQRIKSRPIGSKLDLLLWCMLVCLHCCFGRLAAPSNPTKG